MSHPPPASVADPLNDNVPRPRLDDQRSGVAVIMLHPNKVHVAMIRKQVPHIPDQPDANWQFLQGPYVPNDPHQLIGEAARNVLNDRLRRVDNSLSTPADLVELLDIGHKPTNSLLPLHFATEKQARELVHHWALFKLVGEPSALRARMSSESLQWVACWQSLEICQPFRRPVYEMALGQFLRYLPDPPPADFRQHH